MRAPTYLFRQKVSIEEYQGDSGYSGPQYKAPYTQKARIDVKRRRIRDRQGDEVVSEAKAFFPYDQPDITANSKISWEGRTYTVIESRPIYGFSRRSHLEVWLG